MRRNTEGAKLVSLVIAMALALSISCGKEKNKGHSPAATALKEVKGDGTKPSPDEVVTMLKEGNERFVNGKSLHPHGDKARLLKAGRENQGDYAYATVITCSDSRVPVEMIFDAGIMDIFVIRVAGNVCDTDEAGSIEYGLAQDRKNVV